MTNLIPIIQLLPPRLPNPLIRQRPDPYPRRPRSIRSRSLTQRPPGTTTALPLPLSLSTTRRSAVANDGSQSAADCSNGAVRHIERAAHKPRDAADYTAHDTSCTARIRFRVPFYGDKHECRRGREIDIAECLALLARGQLSARQRSQDLLKEVRWMFLIRVFSLRGKSVVDPGPNVAVQSRGSRERGADCAAVEEADVEGDGFGLGGSGGGMGGRGLDWGGVCQAFALRFAGFGLGFTLGFVGGDAGLDAG